MKQSSEFSPLKGALILIIGVFFVSWASILIRLSQSAPTTIAFFRMFFSTIMMAAALPFYRGGWFRQKSDFYISALSGVFLGLHFYTWVASLKLTSISSSVFLVTTQPVFVAIFGYLFLKEKIRKTGFIAILLAIVGSYLVARGDFQLSMDHLIGDMLALAGAITAGTYLFIGRFVRQRVDLIPYVLVAYGVSSIVILTLGAIFKSFEFPVLKSEYLIFFLIAFGPTILGHNLYNYSLRHLPAFPVGMSILGEPVFATIWGMLIFFEFPLISTIIGGLIIILAVILVMGKMKIETRG